MGTLNAVENVALPLSFRGVPRDVRVRKANEMLDLVKLGKHKKHLPNQMSGGQQQRVGVARALVVDPDIIFADEFGFPYIGRSHGTDAAGGQRAEEDTGHGHT